MPPDNCPERLEEGGAFEPQSRFNHPDELAKRAPAHQEVRRER